MNINRLWGGYTFKLKPRVCCMGPNAMWGWSVGVKPHTYTQGVVIATAGSQKKTVSYLFFHSQQATGCEPAIYICICMCVSPSLTPRVYLEMCVYV